MNPTKRIIGYGSLTCIVWVLCFSAVNAGHFKYATLSWLELNDDIVPPNTVRFTLLSAWSTEYSPYKAQGTGGVVTVNDVIRIQGLGNPVLEFGDGISQLLKATVISVDSIYQSWLGISTVDYTYPTNGAWLAKFSGCCRSSYLVNNADEYWNVTSMVNLNRQSMSRQEGWTFSPRIPIPPRITVRANRPVTFFIPATTPGAASVQLPSGRPLKWALGSRFDHGGPTSLPFGNQSGVSASVNAATGQVAVTAPPGIYSACIIVTDPGFGGSSVAVDFELQALAATPAALAPDWDLTYPAAPAPATTAGRGFRLAFAGFRDTFVLRFNHSGPAPSGADGSLAAAPGAMRPALLHGLLPAGMQVGPLVVSTRNGVKGYQANVSWLPSAAQRNETAACFAALGSDPAGSGAGASPPLCVAYDVEADPAPEWVGTGACEEEGGAAGGTICRPNATMDLYPPPVMGKRVTVVLVARDANVLDDLNISLVALPASRDLTVSSLVSIDESGFRQVTRTVSWVPGPTEGGLAGSLCVAAEGRLADQQGVPMAGNRGPALCLRYQVRKCVYRVGVKEALADIAGKFQMSWLQLWALNKHIHRPEGYDIPGAITEGDVIHVGQVVVARRGDSVEGLAGRLGTTAAQVLAANRDVDAVAGLLLGQVLCVAPNSCSERSGG